VNYPDAPNHAPAIEPRSAAALLRGVHPRDVAECYGVNLRTAYRWKRALVDIEVVTLGNWQAVYAIRDGVPPIRIGAWEPVE
jgi:hypothetical protein